MAFCPPLIITAAQMDDMFGALRRRPAPAGAGMRMKTCARHGRSRAFGPAHFRETA
jgi:hypothetical protein